MHAKIKYLKSLFKFLVCVLWSHTHINTLRKNERLEDFFCKAKESQTGQKMSNRLVTNSGFSKKYFSRTHKVWIYLEYF